MRRVDIPSEAEKLALVARAQAGDLEARNEMVVRNMPLVASIARRMAPRDVGAASQEGAIGLIEAIGRYDPGRGATFATHATWWIRREIHRHLRKSAMIRVDWRQDGEGEGLPERKSVGASVRAYVLRAKAREARTAAMSLSKKVERSGTNTSGRKTTLGDTIPAREEYVEPDSKDGAAVEAAMARLAPRLAEIVVARVYREETLAEVGERVGVCRERVRQLQKAAIEELRGLLE